MVVFKLLVAFALMVVLIRMKVPVGVTLIVGTLLLGLMFGMSVEELGLSIARSVIDLTTIRLVVLVAMVILLSEVMRQSGALKKIEGSVKLLFKDSRWGLATIPALIGLMPMPSGALISAPMIEPIADELRLDAPHRTFVNYWFRHIWEYSW
ncbi:MAG: TIGR00529 family membrane protein, partial [Candidatus Hydrothermota bacterium]